MSSIPSVALYTGAHLPLFGLGTWTAMNAEELRIALRVALDSGYRLIDTAEFYQNEHVIGEVLEEYFTAGKLRREEVFITTKLPFNSMQPEEAEASIKKQLSSLRLSYIDLYLIHVPCPMKMSGTNAIMRNNLQKNFTSGQFIHEDIEHIDTWRTLEKYYRSGQLRALGVSNFNASQIQSLFDKAEIKPANLQVELHIYWPQHELHELCEKLKMTLTAYAPIGSPGRLTFRPNDNWPIGSPMDDPVVEEMAKRYGKTPAEILLRHLIQRGISVIPKSTNPERVKQNIDIFDFELCTEDQKKLLGIQKRVRLFEFRYAAGNKHYPFDDVDLTKKND
ncbi:hypothetical protein PENTCL1PPCAC_11010, partial [Pristionchus entomophagus]